MLITRILPKRIEDVFLYWPGSVLLCLFILFFSRATQAETNETIIMHADFQKVDPGPYSLKQLNEDFLAAEWGQGLERSQIMAENNQHFLRITYTGKKYGPKENGMQAKFLFKKTYNELYLRYRIRFADGFQFMRGGKLPGLIGGTAPTGCISSDDGFSARMMWRHGGEAVQYLYHPNKRNLCGDDFSYSKNFIPGKWHKVEHRLVMNTPGIANGILQTWMDDEPTLDLNDFIYRLKGKTFGIDGFYFSTFFGGNDQSWAPPKDQVVDMDDFVISTHKGKSSPDVEN